MSDKHKKPRPKPRTIQTVPEKAPWMLISQAAAESNLTELNIRRSGLSFRKFGTAEYVRPSDLNKWIEGNGQEAALEPKRENVEITTVGSTRSRKLKTNSSKL